MALAGSTGGQDVVEVGSLRTGVAWSTSKVPIAMAVIAAGAGQAQRQNLEAAITRSDNSAAERLWEALGEGRAAAQAADAQLRAAGDTSTMIESRQLLPGFSSFGQTRWSLRDQAIFSAGMACTGAGAAVLALMGKVDPSQRWGLGAADVAAEFKGGWGPGVDPGVGSGYLDRQMGLLTLDGRRAAVAIAAAPADGSHESGISALTEIARWIVARADPSELPADSAC